MLELGPDCLFVKEVNGGFVHRRVIYAGHDFSAEPDEVRAFAASNGFDKLHPAPQIPYTPTTADIKDEAGRRITAVYPLYKQLNIIRSGGEALATMSAYIDGVRAASNALEQKLPVDFANDGCWP